MGNIIKTKRILIFRLCKINEAILKKMLRSGENEKLSIAECRKILNSEGAKYTDEEIIKIRDWIYMYAELTLELLEGKTEKDINEMKMFLTEKVKIANVKKKAS